MRRLLHKSILAGSFVSLALALGMAPGHLRRLGHAARCGSTRSEVKRDAVAVPVVEFHADTLAWLGPALELERLPLPEAIVDSLSHRWARNGMPLDVGLDWEIWPYWFLRWPPTSAKDLGWTLEMRAVDVSTGEVIAAGANAQHRFGPAFLWKWSLRFFPRLVKRTRLNLGSVGREQLPRVGVDVRRWKCSRGSRFIRAVTERLLDELLWTNRVVPVTGPRGGEAEFQIEGEISEGVRPDKFMSLDVLRVRVRAVNRNRVVLRKTFIAEPGLDGCSPEIEAPLANAKTAARVIAEFLNGFCRERPHRPEIVSREDWGARPAKQGIEGMRYEGDPAQFLNWIVVHHTAYTPSGPKEVQDEHMLPRGSGPGKHPFGRGWLDVGYHFMISKDGTIYEGRKLCYVGAHVGGTAYGKTDPRLRIDFGAIGIALFGDFRYEEPTRQQKESLFALLDYLTRTYCILPDHVVTHGEIWWLARRERPLGGPTTPETECPGEKLQKLVEHWRDEHVN